MTKHFITDDERKLIIDCYLNLFKTLDFLGMQMEYIYKEITAEQFSAAQKEFYENKNIDSIEELANKIKSLESNLKANFSINQLTLLFNADIEKIKEIRKEK